MGISNREPTERPESAASWISARCVTRLATQLTCTREASPDRRPLLRLPLVLCPAGALEFPRRTNQRDPRIHLDRPANAERSAAGHGRRLLGRRFAPKA